jgi:thiamine-monophosphate kinase
VPSDEKVRVQQLKTILGPTLFRDFGPPDREVKIDAGAVEGDDCAVIDIKGPITIVWGSDFIRGSGFKLFELGLLNHYDLGWYLIGANLSDIAAMGARPLGVVTVVRYPATLSDEEFLAVITGARDAAASSECEVLGGDTGGADELVLSASALGFTAPERTLTRTGAQPGDLICLSGSIGRPAAALVYFSREDRNLTLRKTEEEDLLHSWRRVEPRVQHGIALSDGSLASACQDVSDGLRATAHELAASSKVRFELDVQAIPIAESTRGVANLLGLDPIGLALSASVDFELLFCVPENKVQATRQTLRALGLPLYEIGAVVEGQGAVLRTGDEFVELPGVSWRHQHGDVGQLISDALKEPARPDPA